ncbi:MAG: YigZ family protein [Wenzhouxiangellaceae bacterium]|nr:YigZ family protein [Wenzhouxiangellaceae bacterium]
MNRLTGIARWEQTIRKSRFIGVCGPVENESDAREFIETHGEPGCRHVCFAWLIGEQVRFSDAGEPGGTAGRPILAAIEHFELDRAIVVVSRFFGGIKLGIGGLARAYGGTAMETLALASIEPIVETRRLICEVPFEAAGDLHNLAERHGAQKHAAEWSESGLKLELEIPRTAADAFIKEVNDVSRGESSVKFVGRVSEA